MTSSRDASARLAHLEQILSQTTPGSRNEADAAEVHLASVPVERIRRLTAELQDGSSRQPDELDTLVTRLLLNEFATAVLHLRAVARIAASRVDGAAAPMREARRALHRHAKSVDAGAPNWLDKSEPAP